MTTLTPIDYDPFEQSRKKPRLTPVTDPELSRQLN
jgi:hypothetical protein